jgi:hypothetical protein
MTLGIGAAWEIVEYFWDSNFGTQLQASLTSEALADTMHDLIVDALGGLFGALIAMRYVSSTSAVKRAQIAGLTRELADDYHRVTRP